MVQSAGEGLSSAAQRPGGAPAAPSDAPILALAAWSFEAGGPGAAAPEISGTDPATLDVATRARAFAQPLMAGRMLDTGEPVQGHAEGVAAVLRHMGGSPALEACAFLVYASDALPRAEEVIAQGFGADAAAVVGHTRRLVQIQRQVRHADAQAEPDAAGQLERVRKMLLAFSRDLRVVLLRLASRLQTLRWHARSRTICPPALARESLELYAPLANRLGIWQIKWELEDLAFRFLQPEEYHRIAGLLQERRVEREAGIEALREEVAQLMLAGGLEVEVQGRPKHLYSIWKKMRGKRLDFERLMDLRALRVIVSETDHCYAALARLHAHFQPVDGEFDDYIAKPKPNGYQSLHTVVLDGAERPLEVQIRTRAMHEHAEFGVAAHWAYKEAGVRGYAGVQAAGAFEDRVAQARKAVLRQLLAWERETSAGLETPGADERIYVFTPQARVVELPAGATPVDFAYHLHTELGHRCRGARVDGAIAALNTRLENGQTVEVVSVREGGPSLDWLNPELGYLASARSRAKVRAWFNAQELERTVARGREQVERLLQREGRTAVKLDELAARLGFRDAAALFEVVGKDEYSLRNIEQVLRPVAEAASEPDEVAVRRSQGRQGQSGVLVVGVGSLLTNLARCCRPAPPDAIAGFVTRGKGVAIHRQGCTNLLELRRAQPDRLIEVAWDAAERAKGAVYPLDVQVEAADRPGLLRDISEVYAREKVNVIGVKTQSRRTSGGIHAFMTFTLELADAARLPAVLAIVRGVSGVLSAHRR